MNSPLKWHGGKHYLASRIVAMMPPHVHYVEPFAGGLSVLLAKDPDGVSEVVNDLNGPLTAFWQCLMNPDLFDGFVRRVQAMPFSEALFQSASDHCESLASQINSSIVDSACAFFVRCRQSLAGRMNSFAPLSRTHQARDERTGLGLDQRRRWPA